MSLLCAPWWQGVGGVAQILAGVLAAVTVVQAQRTLQQARAERQLLLSPDWSVVAVRTFAVAFDDHIFETQADMLNTGLAPATRIALRFRPSPDSLGERLDLLQWGGHQLPHEGLIRPSERMRVSFRWDARAEPTGSLEVDSLGLAGAASTATFHLVCTQDNGHSCSIVPHRSAS